MEELNNTAQTDVAQQTEPVKLPDWVKGAILLIVVALAIIAGIYHGVRGGQWTTRPVEAEVFLERNPARAIMSIEKCNTITCVVSDIQVDTVYNTYNLHAKLPGTEEGDYLYTLTICAYMSLDDLASMDVGDTVTIRGDFSYSADKIHDDRLGMLFIGSSSSFFPFMFHAQVLDVQRADFQGDTLYVSALDNTLE